MYEPVMTGDDFPALQKYYDLSRGVYPEFTNLQDAKVAFRQEMRRRGYRPGGNKSWCKSGVAVVMEPN